MTYQSPTFVLIAPAAAQASGWRRGLSGWRAAALLLGVAMAMPAGAEGAGVDSHLKVSRVVRGTDGVEQLESATYVKPGDLLEYTAVYTNRSRQGVRGLTVSLPIPVGTEVAGAAALPRDVTASVDGKSFAAVPLTRQVRRADGRVADEPVPLAEYRYLRWPEQKLAPAAEYSAGVRVRVVASAPTPR